MAAATTRLISAVALLLLLAAATTPAAAATGRSRGLRGLAPDAKGGERVDFVAAGGRLRADDGASWGVQVIHA